MDACRFHHDIRVEKANAISRYRRIQRLTVVFRCVEIAIVVVVLSSFSGRFAFSVNQSAEYLREVSAALISPRFVFLLGNAIVIALFFISGGFSPQNGERFPDFYDEYVEKCRRNQMIVKSDAYRFNRAERKIKRSNSQNLRAVARRDQEFARRKLRRNLSEKPHHKDSGKDVREEAPVASTYVEDGMSNEEFRRTVEAFIARQQRFLREEGEIPS